MLENDKMSIDSEIKTQVREFYDQVGWQEVSEGLYQNARYEDLRPISREYIQRCHMRVQQHLKTDGRLLLDAGSGPIQYPEYLEYSRNYQYRVCADISIVALQEARKRIGNHGLFVVADIANLPFKPDCFDGIVSLHAIHHLPPQEHKRAFEELYRSLKPGCNAVVVNGWSQSLLMNLYNAPIHWVEELYAFKQNGFKRNPQQRTKKPSSRKAILTRHGTFVSKHNAAWLTSQVGIVMPLSIWVWRSVSVRFLRTFIHERRGGRRLLRFLFWLEERFPHFFGKYGQYPLIEIRKSQP
jgi:SAM-dependent methyltransferase